MKLYAFLFSLLLFKLTSAQQKIQPVAKFTFNNKSLSSSNHNLKARAYGVSWVKDRFGNNNNACYLQGGPGSYINLGSSDVLKPKRGSISIWVNISHPMLHGIGVESNPILRTRVHSGEDHNEAVYIGYDYLTQNLNINTTLNKEKQLTIYCVKQFPLREWHHIVMTYDNQSLCLYLDGKLEGTMKKDFESEFLEGDSLIVGNYNSIKNKRYFNGSVDDIEIYDRVLKPSEIADIYNAPNPNKNAVILYRVLLSAGVLGILIAIGLLIRWRVRLIIKKEKEKDQLLNKSLEQEIKVLKAQMDPHFIFNSLNSILHFIITRENEKAEIYLNKFSKLIRKLLESNTLENISLEDEIDILKKYLEIESLRFNEVFHYNIQISNQVSPSKLFIPHMLIQPFIENALWHGLRLKNGIKELHITFQLADADSLLCIIDDNGVGINKNKSVVKKNKSLAINFIQQRLELMSKIRKKNYTLNIIDKREHGEQPGTRVELTIPIHYN
jgi:hypothetical protein